jgi:uncharacterized membrane protein YraQ (UPF0718 family)
MLLMNHPKRIALLLLMILALLAQFWLGSRYPALDEKAAMAGEVVMGDVLSFDAKFPMHVSDPMGQKIVKSTGNWIWTNRQGMTFGVLLASLVLTLLQVWRIQAGKQNVFKDILKGMLIGAPLGVCVNCAAPIAYGMRKQGMAAGTSLATLFASPTLNIVVLAMTFSILPLHMAVTKVVATVAFLLLVLPLLVRWGSVNAALQPAPPGAKDIDCVVPRAAEAWLSAIFGLARDLWRNFLFIAIRTVPLMVLAGFLGAAMANLVPLDSVSGWPVTLGTMGLVALLGTFAPVPMAFDVVVVQALLAAGLPQQFGVVLLLTLGMYSIYAFFLVSRVETWRFASQLFLAIAAVGLAAGYASGAWQDFAASKEARIFSTYFSGYFSGKAGGDDSMIAVPAPAASADSSPLPADGATTVWQQGVVRLAEAALQPRSAAGALPFARASGHSIGLQDYPPMLLDFEEPFAQGRGIAAADFDRDGWPDLALANNQGVGLYHNQGGSGFVQVPLDIPQISRLNALLVAFVDIDNNGCLDLFVGAFGAADYFVLNDCKDIAQGQVIELPHETGLMTQAAAFADIDRDGDVDLLKGNWFFLIPRVAPSARATNFLAFNQGGGEFLQIPESEISAAAITGETLTVSLSDLDGDGNADMTIGNDFMEPDIFYRGTGSGQFEHITAGGGIPISTLATMSIDAADIDNDLDLDVFFSGKVNDFSMRRNQPGAPSQSHEELRSFVLQHRKEFAQAYCALFETADDRQDCTERFALGDLFRHSSLEDCFSLANRRTQEECMITIRMKNALIRHDWSFCSEIPASFPVHREVCTALAEYDAVAEPRMPNERHLAQGAIEQKDQGNVFLVQNDDGTFSDVAEEFGVRDAYWAWNARFADLDLDEWQDLYVANGWWLETTMYSNAFFHNEAGKGFTSQATEFGLENFSKQHAFVYIDVDLDGDQDIISRSLDGGLDLFTNTIQDRHSISFEFRDRQGNHFGIGNRLTIYYGEGETRHQVREITLGGGFVSFNPLRAHFGLGDFDQVSRVQVNWVDGTETIIEQALAADRSYIISRETSGKSP